MLDPRVKILQYAIAVSGRAFTPHATVAQVRAGYAELNRRFGLPDSGGVETERLSIPLRDGAHIEALVHRAADSQSEGCLLFFHGGGWVLGDIESYQHITRFFARESGLTVVSAGYRLGPEHRFPAGFEDGFDAYAYVVNHASELRIDAARIAVGGDSAGATIAAAIGAFHAGRGLPRPAHQLLIYPPLDGTARFPSRATWRYGDMIVPAMRAWFAEHALRDRADLRHPYLTLVDAPAPERHPPTYLLAAGFDVLVDEGRAYAERLRGAGVPVVYDLRPTLPHGLVNIARVVPEARRALRTAIATVARAI